MMVAERPAREPAAPQRPARIGRSLRYHGARAPASTARRHGCQARSRRDVVPRVQAVVLVVHLQAHHSELEGPASRMRTRASGWQTPAAPKHAPAPAPPEDWVRQAVPGLIDQEDRLQARVHRALWLSRTAAMGGRAVPLARTSGHVNFLGDVTKGWAPQGRRGLLRAADSWVQVHPGASAWPVPAAGVSLSALAPPSANDGARAPVSTSRLRNGNCCHWRPRRCVPRARHCMKRCGSSSTGVFSAVLRRRDALLLWQGPARKLK